MRACGLLALLLMAATPSETLQAQTPLKTKAPAVTDNQVIAAIQNNRLPHKTIYPGEPLYAESLAKTGVQGEVKLELLLTKEDKLKTAKIVNSSQSAELDKSALAYVNGGSWKLPDNSPKNPQRIYSFSVIFLRDSVLTINKKTCADFNADLKYFQLTWPHDEFGASAALELIASIFTVQLMKNQGAGETLKYVKSVKAINNDTQLACAKKPGAFFVATYVKAANQNKIKF